MHSSSGRSEPSLLLQKPARRAETAALERWRRGQIQTLLQQEPSVYESGSGVAETFRQGELYLSESSYSATVSVEETLKNQNIKKDIIISYSVKNAMFSLHITFSK